MAERSLDGRAASVTGGATVVRAAIWRRLAPMGARVCVCQRSYAKAQPLVGELQRPGAEAASLAGGLATLEGCGGNGAGD